MLFIVQRLRCEILEPKIETAGMTGRNKTFKEALVAY